MKQNTLGKGRVIAFSPPWSLADSAPHCPERHNRPPVTRDTVSPVTTTAPPPGSRIVVRDAEWVVHRVDSLSDGGTQLTCTGVSELVREREAVFLTRLEDGIKVLDPAIMVFAQLLAKFVGMASSDADTGDAPTDSGGNGRTERADGDRTGPLRRSAQVSVPDSLFPSDLACCEAALEHMRDTHQLEPHYDVDRSSRTLTLDAPADFRARFRQEPAP